jgi:microcystin-dependent protein
MDNYIGEIRVFAFNQVIPDGWVPCEGQSLNPQGYAALFSLIGIKYGGDGVKTFNLPDLRGQAMVGFGLADSGNYYSMGKPASSPVGTEKVSLNRDNTPIHTHPFRVSNATGSVLLNKNNDGKVLFAKLPNFSTLSDNVNYFINQTPEDVVSLYANSVAIAGGSAGHENRMPYLPVQVCIATKGIYPSRS